jgi:hypothetical protein
MRRAEMQALEKEEYDRLNFVNMLKSTEENVNKICNDQSRILAG